MNYITDEELFNVSTRYYSIYIVAGNYTIRSELTRVVSTSQGTDAITNIR